jgi:hypothetical protein
LNTPYVVRWIASSFSLALVVTEHARLAFRSDKRWSLLVPFAPLALAWRRDDRSSVIPSAVALALWLLLRVTS